MARASPYDLLEDETWRIVHVQGAIFAALSPWLAELHDLGEAGSSVKIRGALNRITETAHDLGNRRDGRKAVHSAAKRLSGIFEELSAGAATPIRESRLLRAMAARLRSIDAASPYEPIFQEVTGRAEDAYRSNWRPATLSMGRCSGHPRGGGDPYALRAETEMARRRVVELAILPDQFGPAAFAVLPALLIHECVCHVPANQSGEVDNSSIFCEGFMDWVASFFVRQWMPGIAPELAAATIEHAAALTQITMRGDTLAAAARLQGRRAAQGLETWLVAESGLPQSEATARVVRLGLELNVVDVPPVYKNAAVSWFQRPLPRRVAEIVDDWLKGTRPAADLLWCT